MVYESYVVWTNKGGTGKTTLTFHLSTEYAIKYPDKNIIVIDMCPQGNLSTVLLSGVDKKMNGTDGDTNWKTILTQNENYTKTVCGYLLSKLAREPINNIPNDWFLVQPSQYNNDITKNVYLLCGDPYLGTLAKRLEQERRVITTEQRNNPWRRITIFIKDFIDPLTEIMNRDCIVFIDTNSSFSVYTEMAIVGATRIIVPINADEFSRAAVASMLYLLYRIELGEEDNVNERDQGDNDLEEIDFNRLAPRHGLSIPKIHLVISNRDTTYRRASSNASKAKATEVWELLESIHRGHPNLFVSDTREGYECKLNDLHTKAVHCLQLGCPLSKLPNPVKMHGFLKVFNSHRGRINYLENLRSIINRL